MSAKLIRHEQVQTKAALVWAAALLSPLFSKHQQPYRYQNREIKETVHHLDTAIGVPTQHDLFSAFQNVWRGDQWFCFRVSKFTKSTQFQGDASAIRQTYSMYVYHKSFVQACVSLPQVRSSGLMEVMSWPCRDWG